MTEQRKGTRVLLLLLALLLLLGSEAFFFRNLLTTDQLMGDSGDGRLTMLVAEHWYHVFRGEAAVTDLGFFDPAPNTLGYSDILLGYGIPHALFRLLGMDMYTAYKATLMLVHLIGTLAAFALLKGVAKLDTGWALAGTMVFSFANACAEMLVHTQMGALSMVPLLLLFLALYFRNLGRKKRVLWALLSILTLVMILYTAWYIFFYTALFGVIFLIIGALYLRRRRKSGKPGLQKGSVRKLLPELCAWLGLTAVLMIPFALLELEILKISGGRSYGEVWSMLPEAADFVNVGLGNLVFGSLMGALNLNGRENCYETGLGFSAGILLILGFILFHRHRQKKRFPEREEDLATALARVGGWTVLVSCLLMLRFSSAGTSLWYFVFRFFPGASSIRAAGRYLFFLSLPLGLALACLGQNVSRKARKKKWYPGAMTALLALIFLFNFHSGGIPSAWTRSGMENFISSVPEPPEDCETFFLTNVPEGTAQPYYQLDAYQIADHYGIRTLNGYSGLYPPGWGPMWNVNTEAYLPCVREWVANNGLTGVYGYDEVNHVWTPLAELQ